jgi:uncharacterized membrane protein
MDFLIQSLHTSFFVFCWWTLPTFAICKLSAHMNNGISVSHIIQWAIICMIAGPIVLLLAIVVWIIHSDVFDNIANKFTNFLDKKIWMNNDSV